MSNWVPPSEYQHYNGYSYTPFYYAPPETPQQKESKRLRRDANYVGTMMLALAAGTQLSALIVVLALALFGVLDLRQMTDNMFGMSNTQYLLVYSVIYMLAIAAPAIIVALCWKRRQFPLSPSKPVSGGIAFWGVLAAMGVCMVANLVANIVLAFFEQFGVSAPEMPDMLVSTPTSLLLNLLVIAVLPALLEEMVFRGYVLQALRPYGDWFAVFVSSFLFALMHGNIQQIPFAFCVGLALGWLCVYTNNIWLAVAVHFCNNGMSVLLDYCGRSLPEAEENVLYLVVMVTIGVIGGLAFIVLGVRYRSMFSRLPSTSLLTPGVKVGQLFRAPVFVIGVVVFLLLTVWSMVL